MKRQSLRFHDEALADEDLLRDAQEVDRVLKDFGMDDIFNPDNNDIKVHNMDDIPDQPHVVEERYEGEEEPSSEIEEHRTNYVARSVEPAEPAQKPLANFYRRFLAQEEVPDEVIAQVRRLMNSLSESTAYEVGQHLASIFSRYSITQTIIDFCVNFEGNQNLAATTSVLLYTLYVFMDRQQYLQLIRALIDAHSANKHNIMEILAFCVHYRCFSGEALVELLISINDLDLALTATVICGNIIARDSPAAKHALQYHFQTATSYIEEVKVRILYDMLSKASYATVFYQSFLQALEYYAQHIRKESVKNNKRAQAEYAFHGWTLAMFLEQGYQQRAANRAPSKSVFEQLLDNPNRPTALDDFCYIVSKNESAVYEIIKRMFEKMQEEAFSQFYTLAFRELISRKYGNQVKVYFFDYYAAIKKMTSNSVAQVSRLLAALLTSETPACRLSDVVRKQLSIKRAGRAKKEVVFFDLVCLYCCKSGRQLDNLDEENMVKRWLYQMVEQGDCEKVLALSGVSQTEIAYYAS